MKVAIWNAGSRGTIASVSTASQAQCMLASGLVRPSRIPIERQCEYRKAPLPKPPKKDCSLPAGRFLDCAIVVPPPTNPTVHVARAARNSLGENDLGQGGGACRAGRSEAAGTAGVHDFAAQPGFFTQWRGWRHNKGPICWSTNSTPILDCQQSCDSVRRTAECRIAPNNAARRRVYAGCERLRLSVTENRDNPCGHLMFA
jgi:hypothetical protein